MTYWAAQQTRIGAHEAARYAMSAFVTAGSLVSLAQAGGGSMSTFGRWATCLSVAAANLVAVSFGLSELRWIKVHQARAAAVLKVVLPEVAELQKSVSARWRSRAESGDNRTRFTSTMALQITHWLLAAAALVVALAGH